MPGITEAKVDQYMLSILPPRDSVLQEMEAQAAKRDIPIVGPAVGRVLYQYARLINAKKVFELGSAIGYSTLWFARAVGEDGEVFYTDAIPKMRRGQRIFSPGGRSGKNSCGRGRCVGAARATAAGVRHHL